MRAWMDHVASQLGAAPRNVDVSHFLGTRPAFLLNGNDDLRAIFTHAERIVREGVLGAAHVYIANNILWTPGVNPAPGGAIYTLDRSMWNEEFLMGRTAKQLHEIREGKDTRHFPQLNGYLKDDLARVFHQRLPAQLTADYPFYATTLLFFPQHLPGNCLARSFVPVLVDPKPPHAALIVPARFWGNDARAWWRGGLPEADEEPVINLV